MWGLHSGLFSSSYSGRRITCVTLWQSYKLFNGVCLLMAAFSQYVGIDYSGAATPDDSLKNLRVYAASHDGAPGEIDPPPSRKKYWTRRGVAEWLLKRLDEGSPTLVGIDHAFSFPVWYFQTHSLPLDWPSFLEDFVYHWPTTDPHVYVDFVRDGSVGYGAARTGNTRWRRLTEKRTGAAKSVFHFDVQGSVAKSSHAGIPWLRHIRNALGSQVHFWPFEGWEIPEGRSAIVEVYPSLWRASFAREDRNQDQHDAYCVAAWLQHADRQGSLTQFLRPSLNSAERRTAEVEGWILGVA